MSTCENNLADEDEIFREILILNVIDSWCIKDENLNFSPLRIDTFAKVLCLSVLPLLLTFFLGDTVKMNLWIIINTFSILGNDSNID